MKTFDLLYQGIYIASVREQNKKVARRRFCDLTGLPLIEIEARKSTYTLINLKGKP